MGVKMGILEEERAQGAAEFLLIFGGIIVIVIAAGVYYRNYLNGAGNEINKTDVNNINQSLQNISNKFNNS